MSVPAVGWRAGVLAALTLGALAAAIFAPPIPQPLAYHDFADARSFFGLPHCLNVISNVPFLLAGGYGVIVCRSRCARDSIGAGEHLAYLVFFAGTLLTAFGSAYYHADPDNARLLWDRLPMTFGFAGLASAVLGERIGLRLGRRALAPLLLLGVASVAYWHVSERAGQGNVVPYAIYQTWAIAVVAFAVLAAPDRRYSHGAAWWWVVALYAGAKLAEALDLAIYRLGQIVSGHTLKHLLAAGAVVAVAEILRRRVPAVRQARADGVPLTGEAT